MKKTCKRCVALEWRVWSIRCGLGYPISDKKWFGVPLVDCPKPLTNLKWLESTRYKRPKTKKIINEISLRR